MAVEFTPGGLVSVGTPFEQSKLGQDIIKKKRRGGGGGGSPTEEPAPSGTISKQIQSAAPEVVIKKGPTETQQAFLARKKQYETFYKKTYSGYRPGGLLYESGYRTYDQVQKEKKELQAYQEAVKREAAKQALLDAVYAGKEPYLERRQTKEGSEIRFVDPRTGASRLATREEAEYFLKYSNNVSETKIKKPGEFAKILIPLKESLKEISGDFEVKSVSLGKKIEAGKTSFSSSERKEFQALSTKRRTQEEQLRYTELKTKASNQIKRNNQRVIDTILKTSIDTGIGIKSLLVALRRDPVGTAKQLPSSFWNGIKSDLSLAKNDPLVGITKIGTEYIIFRSINKAGKATIDGISNKLTRLNPKYLGEADRVGQIIKVDVGDGKIVNLKIVGRIPKERFASQINKAGKRLNAVSSQADSLIRLVRNKRIVRKPIPGEQNFNSLTKNLLKKFDNGTASVEEIIRLNKLIKKQGAKGLLERSFFADPTGKIRLSRLGILPENQGSILDYFRNGVTFRKPKPQILIFDNVKLQNFPKSLSIVADKIKKRVGLTKAEADELLKWQLKQSGKFKPLGFVSGESEITLAPGEILYRKGKVGVTIINGKRVPIIKAGVLKAEGRLKTLLNKLDDGRLSKLEGIELANTIRKKTGLKYTLSSLKRDTARYFSLKKAGLSSVIYASRSLKLGSPIPLSSPVRYPTRSITKRTPPGKSRPGKSRPGRSPPPIYPPGSPPPKYGSGSPVPKKPPKSPPPIFPPKRPPRIPSKTSAYKRLNVAGSKKKPKPKKEKFFDVYGKPIKKGGRYIKINKTPLKKTEAEDLRNYITDTSLSRQAAIKPSKARPGRVTIQFPRGYAKKTAKKFRTFRIIKGKKIPLPSGRVIELTKNALDTIQEKKRISLARRIKQIQKPKRINIKKKMNYVRSFRRKK